VIVFWFHLADLFVGITESSRFGFLSFGNKERHPGFRLFVRLNRGLETTLSTISDIGRIRRIGKNTRL